MAHLGYVAHAGARAMTLRRSGTVGVAVPTIDNAIFASGLQAFQRRMAQAGQVVLLAFSDNDRAAERVAGVREALAGAGLALAPQHLCEARYTLADARRATGLILGHAPAPTALVCGNDVLAFGAMLECAAQGLDVPGEVSVVGFDDLDLARQWRPALTAVQVPTEAIWTLAADYLLARLDGSLASAQQREIDVDLLVRASTGPVPGPVATATRSAASTSGTARPGRRA